MNWQLAALFSLVLETVFALSYRGFAKRYPLDARLSTAMMNLFIVMPIAAAWAFTTDDVSLRFSTKTWLLLAAAGTIFAVAKLSAYVANSRIDAAQFSLIVNLEVVVTIFVSSLFLNHTLDLKQLLAVALLLIAATVAVSHRVGRQTLKVDRFTGLTLFSAVLFGIGTSNESYLLQQMNFGTYLILGWGFQTLAMLVFASKNLPDVTKVLSRDWIKQLALLGILRTTSGIAFVYALQKSGNSSLFAGVFSYHTALVVLGSYFVLKEKEAPATKLAATVLATVGLLILI